MDYHPAKPKTALAHGVYVARPIKGKRTDPGRYIYTYIATAHVLLSLILYACVHDPSKLVTIYSEETSRWFFSVIVLKLHVYS